MNVDTLRGALHPLAARRCWKGGLVDRFGTGGEWRLDRFDERSFLPRLIALRGSEYAVYISECGHPALAGDLDRRNCQYLWIKIFLGTSESRRPHRAGRGVDAE